MENKGFTIIELIITIAILSFGIIGVYQAFLPLVKINNSSSLRFSAAYLGQEGVEIIKNIRDNNFIKGLSWSSGLLSCASGCQGDYKTGTTVELAVNKLQAYNPANFLMVNGDGFYSYDAGTKTKFRREITITQPSGTDSLKVDVQVFWDYSGQSYTFETEGFLYNWH